MPFLNGFSLYRPFLEGKGLFRDSTTLGIWRRPIPVIAVLMTLLFTDSPVVLIAIYFLSQTFSMGLLYWIVAQKYSWPTETSPELLNYSKHLSVINIVGIIANNADKILVFHFLGAAPVAIYTLAQLPSTHILKMFGLLGNLIFPKFTRRDLDTLRATIIHKISVYFFATTVVVTLYIVSAPFVFKILFPAYQEAIILSQVLVFVVLLKPFTLYGQIFSAHGMKRAQYFTQISVAVVKLLLLIVLLPLYGLWGAVWTTIATALYWSIIVTVIFYGKKIKNG